MKSPLPRLAACIFLVTPAISPAESLTYPAARRADTSDVLHGVKVADPYRWMEDIDSPETRAWVEAEAKTTTDYLHKLPRRAALLDRLKKLQDYDKLGVPRKIGGKLFYSRKTGLQNQAVMYWKNDAPGAEEHVLLDPNTLSADGTIALKGHDITDDGKLLAYGLSEAGSDWERWKIREVATGKDLPDELRWVKFSNGSWSKKGDGIYYGRYAAPAPGQELKEQNLNQKVYFHRLGEPQEKDTLVYERPDHPKWGLGAGETEDGKYLIISVSLGTKAENALFYRDLQAGPAAPVVELLPAFDAEYDLVGTTGDTFYLVTTQGAPNKRLIALDLKNPQPDKWRTLVPETPQVITAAHLLGGKWIVERMVDAHDDITVYDPEGKKLDTVALPNFGSAGGFGGKQTDVETFYAVTGFDTPGTIYRYDTRTLKSTEYDRTKIDFDPAAVTVEQVFYPSRDGTKVPMFLFHKKGLVKDGNNPVLLYGYGGFNISLTPSFSPNRLAWLEMGGVYAQVNLRGGGEYGKTWHEAGMKHRKQTVFDDFISAGEFLIKEKWTQPSRLAIQGGSNGGLLVAACLNQRPDLFACGLPAVGVQDMLRFHKFTIGWAWQEEYGSPDDSSDFGTIFQYSPLHNIKPGAKYPATMVMTGDHDDRVYPAHSFKYAAELQHSQGGDAPILLRVDLRAGHGAGKPTIKALEEAADAYAFAAAALKM
ncbi:MAG: prolyl oligopeptidase family serine peptidase [Verrucomicrobiota bacterium]